MLGNAKKVFATERMLQDLTQRDNTIDIPGNFRAQQRRQKHDDSRLVFPESKYKGKPKGEKHQTHYTLNFKQTSKQNCRPSERPCSPTRRNNPHPSKNFLTWRIPTRVFDYGEEKKANISFLNSNINDTYQSFYNDYSGNRTSQSEVDTKLLLEMTKSYSGDAKKKDRKSKIELKSSAEEPCSLTLPSLLRKSWSPNQSSLGVPKGAKRETLSPIFIKEELQPLFQSWYDDASSKDKEKNSRKASKTPDIIAEMEENYLQKALEKALEPDAIEAIEDWLQGADEEEREIAMQFIQTLLLASIQKQKIDTMKQTHYPRALTPLTRTSQQPPSLSKPKKDHHHTKACAVCARKNLEAALQQLQVVAAHPYEMPGITELLNPLHPTVVAKKEDRKRFVNGRRRLQRPQKMPTSFKPGNKGSLFVSQKPRGRHYTIHPEWL